MKAMMVQASRLTLTSRAFRNDQLGLLYKEIRELINYHKILPMNSGAEAVESAIKAVQKWGYEVKGVRENQAKIIVCENNFHGRTLTIISFSTDPTARGGSGPFTPGFKSIPYGNVQRSSISLPPGQWWWNDGCQPEIYPIPSIFTTTSVISSSDLCPRVY